MVARPFFVTSLGCVVAIGDGRRSPKRLNHLLKVFITVYPLTVVGWLVALVRSIPLYDPHPT
jgi:hypothetical protein